MWGGFTNQEIDSIMSHLNKTYREQLAGKKPEISTSSLGLLKITPDQNRIIQEIADEMWKDFFGGEK